MDHTVLPADPCLPFLRERSPDGTTTTTEAADIQLQLTTYSADWTLRRKSSCNRCPVTNTDTSPLLLLLNFVVKSFDLQIASFTMLDYFVLLNWDVSSVCNVWILQATEESISEADDTMDRVAVHHVEWKSKMRQARAALRTLLTDALLTAGYVVYCGPLEQPLRDSLLSNWLSRYETTDFSFETTAASGSDLIAASSSRRLLTAGENCSVEEVTGFAELLPELETSGMLTDTGSCRNAALVYSCLFCRGPLQRWTFLIDPDKQAESCIRFLLAHASTPSCSCSNGELIMLIWFLLVIQMNYVAL